MSLSPLVAPVAAHDSILLSTDVQHLIMEPGQTTNLTLGVENNGSSIESYNITADTGSLATYWEVLPAEGVLENVFPTWTKNTTVVVRLQEGATVSDSGSFTLTVTEPDSGVASTTTVLVSVAPSYHPSISSTSGSQGPVLMAAGSSANLTFTVDNLGSVEDTFLLDVEVEPDLSSWWANQSSNSSGNSSQNGTGNSSGGNQSSPSMSVLMMGNSYTTSNNLALLVDKVLDADGYNGSVTSRDAGGMSLAQHWANVNTSGHSWNTTLRGNSWDYTILQDQSQIPSLPTTDSDWQASKNASVLLSEQIEVEGSETVLFMTWGRRSGESGTQWHQYNNINQNFTNMQERLTEGYTRYAENITAAGNTVWIAPVGLAFKTIHDAVEANGVDPTQSGNLFYDLYTNDGSHPSLEGSYLAACVMHSTVTGESCVGSNASVSLSASVRLELQQAADDTVFNQTAGMSYYPWEVSGTTAFGLGSTIPQGWYLQWQDDELSNIPAGGSQSATLSLTVPTDAAPEYYGYRLTVGSTEGNVTSSTLLVVQVEAEPDISLAFLDQSTLFLPGESTPSSVQVTNTGNAELDLEWDLAVDAGEPCSVALVSAQTSNLLPDAVDAVDLLVEIDEGANSGDECEFTLSGIYATGASQDVLEALVISIDVDEAVNFSLLGPMNIVDIVPSIGSNYEVRVTNHGSDDATFFLDVVESQGLDTVLVSASGITVAAGELGVWTVNSKGDTSLSGIYQQSFESTYEGMTSTLLVDINLLEVDGISLSGPSEDRVLVAPGGTSTITVDVANTGTSNLTLLSTINGLPVGVDASISSTSFVLSRTSTVSVDLTFEAQTGATPSTTSVVLSFGDGTIASSWTFDLVVVDREEVLVNSVSQRILANPATLSTITVDATNLGTQADVYVIDWSAASTNDWFTFEVSPTTFQLSAGSTQIISIDVREVGTGAPEAGVVYSLTATSTTNPSVSDSINITVESVQANANLSVLREKSSAGPGETVYGSVLLTNTGNSDDTFSVSTVGADCGLDATVSLAPGLASTPLGWSCTVPNDATAGQRIITFRAVSSIRSNVAVEYSILYDVEPSWPGDSLVALSFESPSVSLGVDSSTSTVLTVQNLANAEVSGTLDVLGQDTGVLLLEWVRLSDQSATSDYTLTPGSSIEFKLTIISNTARTATSEVVVRATSSGGGVLTSDQSLPLIVSVEGPALPPNGLSLPLGLSVSQPATLGVMGAGWLIAALAIMVLRRRNDSDDVDKVYDEASSEDDQEEEEEQEELGYNECRMDGESKVNCPTCDARLGVPRGSTPPFRFTCPQCDNKIRVIE